MANESHFGGAIATQLEAIIEPVDGFTIVKTDTPDPDHLVVTVQVDTRQFTSAAAGLPVLHRERIDLTFTEAWPWAPPEVTVRHNRWLDKPHVLQGHRLCLYLDTHTEWDPTGGLYGLLGRLWEWLHEAIGGQFDPSSALYHPVGGVLHRTPGTPTIVVGGSIPATERLHHQRILLQDRTEDCVDVVGIHTGIITERDRTGLLVTLPNSLPYGAGHRLSDLALLLAGQTTAGERKRLLAKLRKTARSLLPGDPLQVLVGVPNREIEGAARLHLIAFQLDAQDIEPAIAAAQRRRPDQPHSTNEPQLQWMYVDDMRDAISTRRDNDTPLAFFRGKIVELWGCGALGSWLAEILARAGIEAITLRDPGYVTEGLLVRQNLTSNDVGRHKVDAIADRLLTINPELRVDPIPRRCERALQSSLDADVIIDATVNTAVSTLIHQVQQAGQLEIPLVQIATDDQSATLGIVTVRHPGQDLTTNDLDESARLRADTDPELARYRILWRQDSRPPMVPTTGCSTPTFRGSSADLMAISSTAVAVSGRLLSRRVTAARFLASTET